MANRKKNQQTNNPSLSCQKIEETPTKIGMSKEEIEELNNKVFSTINNLELQKSLDRYLKQKDMNNRIALRDMQLLKSIIMEYLDSFLLFGYNVDGERVIVQNFTNSRDRDAIMEFLKTIFIKQQHDNFLDDE